MKHYEYTNPHPSNDKKLGDCVIRALSIATGKDWLTIYDELAKIGREQLAPMTDMKTVHAYIETLNTEKIPVKFEDAKTGKTRRITARVLATAPNKATYIIRTAGHLATVKDGKLRDTCDSLDRAGYIVWKIV